MSILFISLSVATTSGVAMRH